MCLQYGITWRTIPGGRSRGASVQTDTCIEWRRTSWPPSEWLHKFTSAFTQFQIELMITVFVASRTSGDDGGHFHIYASLGMWLTRFKNIYSPKFALKISMTHIIFTNDKMIPIHEHHHFTLFAVPDTIFEISLRSSRVLLPIDEPTVDSTRTVVKCIQRIT